MIPPAQVQVRIEIARGGRVKRRPDGRIAFISPLPCPFNYGSVPGTLADDGDPLDVLVLGPPLPRDHLGTFNVHGIVRFLDGDRVDDKLVCGRPPDARDIRRIHLFFRAYAAIKVAARWARRRSGRTAFLRFEAHPGPPISRVDP